MSDGLYNISPYEYSFVFYHIHYFFFIGIFRWLHLSFCLSVRIFPSKNSLSFFFASFLYFLCNYERFEWTFCSLFLSVWWKAFIWMVWRERILKFLNLNTLNEFFFSFEYLLCLKFLWFESFKLQTGNLQRNSKLSTKVL